MKVLIVDDDPAIQRILQRIVTQCRCQAVLASNGVEALAAIETARPDLMLLDVEMPVMDGLATLAAIRASPEHANLPVISISAIADRARVVKIVNLGISDYILKPINIESASRRLRQVMNGLLARRVRERPAPASAAADRKPRLLVVEPDPNFRAFAQTLLEGRFDLVTVASGGEAIALLGTVPIDVICVGQHLSLLSPLQLATAFRDPGRRSAHRPSAICLLTEDGELPPDHADLFDGAIRRSFVPEGFLHSFDKVVASGRSPGQRLVGFVREGLAAELQSAAEQAIGVMSGQEVAVLPPDTEGLEGDMAAVVELTLPGDSRRLVVRLAGSRADMEAVAGRILGDAPAVEGGASDAVCEMLDAIAGRLRTSLAARGLGTELAIPRIAQAQDTALEAEASCTVVLRTPDGARLAVSMIVTSVPAEGAVASDVSPAA